MLAFMWFLHSFLISFAFPSALDSDFALLGLSADADFESVKYAYRREALKWHPDRNSAPDAQDRFISISEAYERLKNAFENPVEPPKRMNAFAVFGTFMGTSQSTSTVIQNGKRTTRTVFTDLSTGRVETTETEEDLTTGRRITRKNGAEFITTEL